MITMKYALVLPWQAHKALSLDAKYVDSLRKIFGRECKSTMIQNCWELNLTISGINSSNFCFVSDGEAHGTRNGHMSNGGSNINRD